MKKLLILPVFALAVTAAYAADMPTYQALVQASADTQLGGSLTQQKQNVAYSFDGNGRDVGPQVYAQGTELGSQKSQLAQVTPVVSSDDKIPPSPQGNKGILGIPGLIPAGVGGVVGATGLMIAHEALGVGLLGAGVVGLGVGAVAGFLLANGKTYSGIGVIGGFGIGVALAVAGSSLALGGTPLIAGLAFAGIGLVAGFMADMFFGGKK